MKANDRQVGGEHYKKDGVTEHWDIVVQNDLDYFQGQITKYIMRWRKKGGVQDLEKARHFLDKYIEVATEESSISSTYIGIFPESLAEAPSVEEVFGKKVAAKSTRKR